MQGEWKTPVYDQPKRSRVKKILLWLGVAVGVFWLFTVMGSILLSSYPAVGLGLMAIGLQLAAFLFDWGPSMVIGCLLVLTGVWIMIHGYRDRQLAELIERESGQESEPITQPIQKLRSILSVEEQERLVQRFPSYDPIKQAGQFAPGVPWRYEIVARSDAPAVSWQWYLADVDAEIIITDYLQQPRSDPTAAELKERLDTLLRECDESEDAE